MDDGLGGTARDARIGAVVRQSLESVGQAVATIPVVDPCRGLSVKGHSSSSSSSSSSRARCRRTRRRIGWLWRHVCEHFQAERPAEEAMCYVLEEGRAGLLAMMLATM